MGDELPSGAEAGRARPRACATCERDGEVAGSYRRPPSGCLLGFVVRRTLPNRKFGRGDGSGHDYRGPAMPLQKPRHPAWRADRRVPFESMVYVGDGLTDIPCFSLLKSSGGTLFGVLDPSRGVGETSLRVLFCPTVSSGCTPLDTVLLMSSKVADTKRQQEERAQTPA